MFHSNTNKPTSCFQTTAQKLELLVSFLGILKKTSAFQSYCTNFLALLTCVSDVKHSNHTMTIWLAKKCWSEPCSPFKSTPNTMNVTDRCCFFNHPNWTKNFVNLSSFPPFLGSKQFLQQKNNFERIHFRDEREFEIPSQPTPHGKALDLWIFKIQGTKRHIGQWN